MEQPDDFDFVRLNRKHLNRSVAETISGALNLSFISMEMVQHLFKMGQPDIHESVIFRRPFQDRMALDAGI